MRTSDKKVISQVFVKNVVYGQKRVLPGDTLTRELTFAEEKLKKLIFALNYTIYVNVRSVLV